MVPGLVGHRSPDIRGVARLPCRIVAAGEEPKSRNGKRTLPLDDQLVAALRKRQLQESTIASATYRSGLAELDWHQGGEYVITDEARTPVQPEWYSDEFGRLLRRAGLRRITLHDSRHTTLTLPVPPLACPTTSGPPGAATPWP